MERWAGKVAIVTGASVGTGPTLMKTLLEKGIKVIGLTRHPHRLLDLTAVKCDIAKEEDIVKAFSYITDKYGPVHILINNATLTRSVSLMDGAPVDWKRVFDINVMAYCICTRETVKIMQQHNIDGHIVHVNMAANVSTSKFAVSTLTDSLRTELGCLQCKIKVTSIHPGVNNERSEFLKAADIAEAIVYALSTGPNVQVQEIIIHSI